MLDWFAPNMECTIYVSLCHHQQHPNILAAITNYKTKNDEDLQNNIYSIRLMANLKLSQVWMGFSKLRRIHDCLHLMNLANRCLWWRSCLNTSYRILYLVLFLNQRLNRPNCASRSDIFYRKFYKLNVGQHLESANRSVSCQNFNAILPPPSFFGIHTTWTCGWSTPWQMLKS